MKNELNLPKKTFLKILNFLLLKDRNILKQTGLKSKLISRRVKLKLN
jgi:hypothetical protein